MWEKWGMKFNVFVGFISKLRNLFPFLFFYFWVLIIVGDEAWSNQKGEMWLSGGWLICF